jgi:hypothetical protein
MAASSISNGFDESGHTSDSPEAGEIGESPPVTGKPRPPVFHFF